MSKECAAGRAPQAKPGYVEVRTAQPTSQAKHAFRVMAVQDAETNAPFTPASLLRVSAPLFVLGLLTEYKNGERTFSIDVTHFTVSERKRFRNTLHNGMHRLRKQAGSKNGMVYMAIHEPDKTKVVTRTKLKAGAAINLFVTFAKDETNLRIWRKQVKDYARYVVFNEGQTGLSCEQDSILFL